MGDVRPPQRKSSHAEKTLKTRDADAQKDYSLMMRMKDQGKALFEKGDLKKSKIAYTSSLKKIQDLQDRFHTMASGSETRFVEEEDIAHITELKATVHNNLSIVERKLGEPKQALEHALLCHRLNPEYKNIKTRIKNYLEEMGRGDELATILKQNTRKPGGHRSSSGSSAGSGMKGGFFNKPTPPPGKTATTSRRQSSNNAEPVSLNQVQKKTEKPKPENLNPENLNPKPRNPSPHLNERMKAVHS
jgi:hypothetical protein